MIKRVLLSLDFMFSGISIYFMFHVKRLIKSNVFLACVRNFGPDVFWAMSFFFGGICFANKITQRPLVLNSVYVLTCALVFELMQYFNVVSGTFDIIDILIYFIFVIFACFIELSFRRKEYEKNV